MRLETGSTSLVCEIEAGVATIKLNCPEKRNALSDELTPALRSILTKVEEHESVQCVLLTGEGNSFCSGGDISSMSDLGSEQVAEKVEQLRMRQRTLTLRLYDLAKPTIAALPGPAVGAGLSLALACDLRYAVDNTFITTGYGKIGLSGDYGGSWLLANLTNTAIAKEMYFSCRRVGSEECYKLGIFNDIFPKAEFNAEVLSIARSLAKGPLVAYRYMKENLNRQPLMSLSECLDMEAESLFRCAETEDHKNAVIAFLEKRTPQFKGF
ncbi:MAG: enoyl-CoA hydratase [Pseudomonadota bacterium]|nr:enoyl-CoA hydratase [Pseudomonadota bacterium]